MSINVIMKPNNTVECTKNRIAELENLIKLKKAALLRAPEGNLRVSFKKGVAEYYVRSSAPEKSGKYIKKSNQKLIKQLAQKKYDKGILTEAERELKVLNSMIKKIDNGKSLEQIYSDIYPEVRQHICPNAIDYDEYKQKWTSEEFERKSDVNIGTEYYTDNNEHVRSKSELLIANALRKNGIAYRYEAALTLRNSKVIHPDFTIIRPQDYQIVYWEHLGMMDKVSYSVNAVERIKMFQQNNIVLGDRLFLSMETSDRPLGTAEVQGIIEKCLL